MNVNVRLVLGAAALLLAGLAGPVRGDGVVEEAIVRPVPPKVVQSCPAPSTATLTLDPDNPVVLVAGDGIALTHAAEYLILPRELEGGMIRLCFMLQLEPGNSGAELSVQWPEEVRSVRVGDTKLTKRRRESHEYVATVDSLGHAYFDDVEVPMTRGWIRTALTVKTKGGKGPEPKKLLLSEVVSKGAVLADYQGSGDSLSLAGWLSQAARDADRGGIIRSKLQPPAYEGRELPVPEIRTEPSPPEHGR